MGTISENWQGGGFASYGDLSENNWEENPDGQEYESEIGSGSSDIQRRVFGTVARQLAETNREFAERYGWDDPARFDADAQAAAGLEHAGQVLEDNQAYDAGETGGAGTIDGDPANLRPAESNRRLAK